MQRNEEKAANWNMIQLTHTSSDAVIKIMKYAEGEIVCDVN